MVSEIAQPLFLECDWGYFNGRDKETDSIVVKWLDEGTGIIRVAEINKFWLCGPRSSF